MTVSDHFSGKALNSDSPAFGIGENTALQLVIQKSQRDTNEGNCILELPLFREFWLRYDHTPQFSKGLHSYKESSFFLISPLSLLSMEEPLIVRGKGEAGCRYRMRKDRACI